MYKETAIRYAIMFLVFAFIIGVIELFIGMSINKTVYACVGSALLFYLLSLALKSEPIEWTCQKCGEKLIRKEIKFGLCPYCGTKVKNFRGLTYRGGIYDF